MNRHDNQCERLPNFFICHCEKRDRLSRGITDLPALVINYPDCGGCGNEVSHNGDSFQCDTCHATWAENATDGDTAERFHDDYDEENETLSEAREHWLKRLTGKDTQ